MFLSNLDYFISVDIRRPASAGFVGVGVGERRKTGEGKGGLFGLFIGGLTLRFGFFYVSRYTDKRLFLRYATFCGIYRVWCG